MPNQPKRKRNKFYHNFLTLDNHIYLSHHNIVFPTSSINSLMDVAEEVRDRAAISFLDWYVKEQVEEESNVGTVLAKLRLIGDDKQALFNLDKELATRTFVAPVIG